MAMRLQSADLDEVFMVGPLEMIGGQNDLLHEYAREADDDAYDGCDYPAIPVVVGRLLSYPLLVDGAVTGHVVEDLILKQVLTTTVCVMLRSVHHRRPWLLYTHNLLLPPPRRLCFCRFLSVCLCVSKITQKVMDGSF